MLFITGLVTLLALSHAGGDHIKGMDHVKGGSHLKTVDHVQQAVAQEEIAPAPYSFNIKTGASYGTKIVREEIGDSDGRVKGSYSVSSPRGTQKVVEYQADDTSFHANIKTLEPNIKTHTPAVIEAVGKKGSGSNAQPIFKGSDEVKGKLHTGGVHHAEGSPASQKTFVVPEPDTLATKGGIKTMSPSGQKTVLTAVSDPQFREPEALPVVTAQIREPIAKPVVSAVKTVPVVSKGGNVRRIKTIRRKTVKTIVPTEQQQEKVDPEISQLSLPDSKRVAPAPRPVTETLPVDQQTTDFRSQISSLTGTTPVEISGLSEKSIIVPGGPLGPSFSLSESEIEKILSSGGVLEFPSDAGPGAEGIISALPGQRQPEIGGSIVGAVRSRSNLESLSQTTGQRIPASRVSAAVNEKQSVFKSQTSSLSGISRTAALGATGTPIAVPGGPGGPTFSLTESEIEKILSSGGVIEFPTGTSAGTFGSRHGQPVEDGASGGNVGIRANVQSFSLTTRPRKPITRISSAIDQTAFKSRSSSAETSRAQISGASGQSVVVPGGPEGPTFSLTESEIQRILSSGGVLEFPIDRATGSVGTLIGQRQTVTGGALGGSVGIRTNEQSVSQISRPRKPITRTSSAVDQNKTVFKSQISTSSSGSSRTGVSGTAGQSVVIPGGPGGASFSLTESEIKKILLSGGVIEFPTDSTTGSVRDINVSDRPKQPTSSVVSGKADITRTNTQSESQATSPRKPITRISGTAGQRQTSFRTQTSISSGSRQLGVSGAADQSVVIPGGPGGASFTLKESEIQKILSSGGVVEFPSGGMIGQAGAINAFGGQRPSTRGGYVGIRSNTQSLTQISKPKKPARISALADKKQTNFKASTVSGSSQTGVSEVSGQSIIVPGGPGGASFSLSETEIQKILSSGGVIEFPSDSLAGSVDVTNTLVGQRQPVSAGVSTRSNVQSISETKPVKPASRTSFSIDKKLTEFQKRISNLPETTGTRVSVTSGQSVVIPGGPGGASFSLTDSEIEKILSSGGVIEFPSDSITGSVGDINASIRQRQHTASVISRGTVTTRSNSQSANQTTSSRKPTTRISSADGQRQTVFRTQTSTSSGIRRENVLGVADMSVTVPGGPGGASFSLKESEIKKILSSGGIVEFPVDKLPGSDISVTRTTAGERQPTGNIGFVSNRANIQSVSQAASLRKPATRTSTTVPQSQTTFRSQTSSSRVSGTGVSGATDNSIVVPGGPGGATFTLTNSEIQKILSSGGIVEFPTDKLSGSVSTSSTSFGQPSAIRAPGIHTSSISNTQSLFVSSNQRKPTRRISSSVEQRRNALVSGSSSTSRGTSDTNTVVLTSSDGPIVVPGASGAPSLTLTETEIENILSTGGIVEIPFDSDSAQKYTIPSAQSSGARSGFQVSAGSQTSRGSSDIPFELGADKYNTQTGIFQQHSRYNTHSKLSRPSQVLLESTPTHGGSSTVTQEKVKAVLFDSSEFQQQKVSQVQEPITQTEQFKQLPFDESSSVVQTQVADGSENQLKMKIDDVVQQSSLPSQTKLSQIPDSTPLQIKLSLENFSNKYLQEKFPVEIPGYVPHPSYMAPFNYRLPLIKGMQSSTPIVQQQQQLEQILI